MAEFDSAIPPGGTGKVVARIRTRGIRGARRKTVTIETNDPDRPAVVLTIAFVSRPAVAVLPRDSLLLSTRIGRPGEAALVLRREDGEPLTVRGVASNLPALHVEAERVLEAQEADGESGPAPIATREGDWLLRVSLEAMSQPLDERAVLRIETDHPDAPTLAIPARVRVIGPIRYHPSRVSMQAGPDPEPTVSRVSLRHEGRREFRVLGATLEGELPGVTAVVVDQGPAPVQTIELSADPRKASPGRFAGHVLATTDLKRAKKIRVPVTLRVVPGAGDGAQAGARSDSRDAAAADAGPPD